MEEKRKGAWEGGVKVRVEEKGKVKVERKKRGKERKKRGRERIGAYVCRQAWWQCREQHERVMERRERKAKRKRWSASMLWISTDGAGSQEWGWEGERGEPRCVVPERQGICSGLSPARSNCLKTPKGGERKSGKAKHLP